MKRIVLGGILLLSFAGSAFAQTAAQRPETFIANPWTWSAAQSFNSGDLILNGSGSGSSTLNAPAAGGGTATLFAGSDTIAGKTLTNGGTNASLTASNGGIVYSTSSALGILAGTATANEPLVSGLSTTPAWAAYTIPSSLTQYGLLYASTTSALSQITVADSCVYLTSSGGVPSCGTTLPAGTTISGGLSDTVTSAITAGATQGSQAVAAGFNIITTCASGSGVTLPVHSATIVGQHFWVANYGANACKVWPASSDSINALAANGTYSVAVDTTMQFEGTANSVTQTYTSVP
jgi:hypothetical protein